MPSKTALHTGQSRPQNRSNDKPRTSEQPVGLHSDHHHSHHSPLTTKVSLAVLLLSCGLFYYTYYEGTGSGTGSTRPPIISVPPLDRLLEAVTDAADHLSQSVTGQFRNYWTKWSSGGGKVRPDSVLAGLLARESSVSVRPDAAIAIGVGACTDMMVDSVRLFGQFAAPSNPRPHAHIDSMQDLLELFAYYFMHGAASERYIRSKAVFAELLQLIKKVPHWTHVGGNAPLMSERFSKEGIGRLLLGAQMSTEFAARLPAHVNISGPFIAEDDYHVLLEYKTGAQWGRYKSPRANRLIVHSDDNNVRLIARPAFFDQAVGHFRPDLVIVSGLQMQDNSPVPIEQRAANIGQLAHNLTVLRQAMATGGDRAAAERFAVHFEMASYTENGLLDAVVNEVFPHIDSYGMNEQEVTNLLSFLKFGNISLVSSPFPRIAQVLDEMRELFTLLTLVEGNRVSRIHVHALAYQVVAVRLDHPDHRRRPKWPNSAAAMAKASLTAYRHTCGSEQVDLNTARILLDESFTTSTRADSRYRQRIHFDASDPTTCWTEHLPNPNPTEPDHHHQPIKVQFCLAIGLVCTNVIQTGGAGDNVSAGGIVLQI